MISLRYLTSPRTVSVHATAIAVAVVASIVVVALPSQARAQKALVYCPIGIDVTGCTNLVAALQPVFPSGVDRGYDGSGGTVDMRSADLWGYSLVAIPSLATTGGSTPYAVLADTALGSRLHDAVLGRVALWSGTPDLGSPNGTQKDTLIQNLGRWASGSYAAVKGPGLVVFQDMSDSIATQYGWLHVIAGTTIAGDSVVSTHATVQGLTPTGTALLRDPSGNTIAYANMAAFGFVAPAGGSGFTVDGVAVSGAGTQNVLLTSLGGNTGSATIATDADDYAPGTIVTITGSGFAPGEHVTVTLRERPFLDTPATITATADKTGAFIDKSFSPDSADLNVRFIATAVGGSSGARAVTTFTDASPSTVALAAQTPAAVVSGNDATFVVTVTMGGNPGSCTATMAAAPSAGPAWPATGVTFTFNPVSVSGQKGDTPTTTLTVHTPVGMAGNTYRFSVSSSGACQGNGTQIVSQLGSLVVAPSVIAGNTSIGSSASTSVFGQAVTFTATVSAASGSAAPTGTIQFLDNGSNLGSAIALSAGVATLSTSTLGAGSHTISAVYTPGTGFSAGTVTSTTQQVTKATPAIAWGTPTAINYGTALSAAQLNATANPAGGTFAYTPASGTVLGAGAQTLSVTFTPTDGADYNTASSSVTLTVNKLAATVTADNQTRAFGQPNPTLTGTLAGFLPADNISASYATSATPASNVGGYPITPTLVDPNTRLGNYSVTPTAGTLTITQATQTIAFTAPSGLHYGDADAPLGATATSQLAVSYVSSSPTVCAIAGTSVHIVGAGSCSVAAQQPGNGNYAAAADVVQSFAIAQRSIGVTANALSKTFGASDPTLTYAVSSGSLVGTDAFTGALSRAAGEGAGTYAIGQGTLSAGANYALAFTGATFTISKADQTISFTQPADPTFGDAPLQLTASASSGLTVAFAASGTCSIAGTTLTITGAGSCLVTASQSGDANHNAASDVPYTLTVKKATPTVTAQGGTFTYDGLTHAATAVATGVGGATLTPVAVTYNGGSTLPRTAGTYSVVASFASSADYLAGSTSATITINQKALSVTADAKSKVYGGATPPFTATFSGFVTNEGPSDLSGTLAFGGSAVNAVDAGTYVITPSGLSSQNYLITFSDGTLNISKAPLTVQAANASRQYGDPNPAFSGTLAGVVNNDNITATYASTASAASPVGTVAITASLTDPNGRLANYDLTNTPGTLTIVQAPLGVKADDVSRVYGDDNPTLTGTITGLKNSDAITASYASAATAASDVGSYPIVPSLSDPTNKLANYAVTSTNGALTVTKASLTIAAANATRLYGGTNPTFTGTITGLKNSDGITASYSTVATPQDNVGSYAIVPAAVDATPARLGNYAVTLTSGTLSITPAPLTVKGDDASRSYGDANPAFTGSLVGLQNGDAITATYASVATPASDVGSYPIVPSLGDPGGKLPNYTVTPTNGTLTVTQAPLTIAAANASRVFGDNNPSFTGTITGIRNGDGISATYSTPATAASNVGAYDIVPTAVAAPPAKLSNYAVTLHKATLTITQATPKIVWAQPADIPQGTPLSGTQLNATTSGVGGAPVAGSFVYVPPSGTVLYTVGPTPLSTTFTSSDGNYFGGAGSTQIRVQNVAPTVTSIALGAAPIAVNSSATISAAFTDPGLTDTHTATISWGDGTTSGGGVTDVSVTSPTGSVSGSHTYSAAGVYTVTVTVADNNGGTGTRSSAVETIGYIVVYDPSAGFVTGGGWIASPPGACNFASCTATTTGKANFGFNARYQKGANVPDGSTEFQFQAGGLNFKSTTYSWLVVAGTRAQYKGSGSINGVAGYGFLLTAIDGDPKGSPDAFRMKIMDSGGNVVYDNQMGADDTGNAATTLGGGSIVIHQ